MGKIIEGKLKTIPGFLISIGIVVSFVVWISWQAYGRDTVDVQIDKKLAPVIKTQKEQGKRIEQINFKVNQTLVLLKKIAPKRAVREMEEETEIFKPEE